LTDLRCFKKKRLHLFWLLCSW